MSVKDISISHIRVTENILAPTGTGEGYRRELGQDLHKSQLGCGSGRCSGTLPGASGSCTSYHPSLVC